MCIKYLWKTNRFLEQSREHFSNVFFADVLHSGVAWQTNHSSHVTLLDWLSIALLALAYTKLQAVMCIKGLTVAYHDFMEILKTWKNFIDLFCLLPFTTSDVFLRWRYLPSSKLALSKPVLSVFITNTNGIKTAAQELEPCSSVCGCAVFCSFECSDRDPTVRDTERKISYLLGNSGSQP